MAPPRRGLHFTGKLEEYFALRNETLEPRGMLASLGRNPACLLGGQLSIPKAMVTQEWGTAAPPPPTPQS